MTTVKICSTCKYGGESNRFRTADVCKQCKVVSVSDGDGHIGWQPSMWEEATNEVVAVTVEKDNVNHPSHYETGKFECIDVMVETQGVEAVKAFCICNAFKYLYRHKNKNGTEDVKKAIWYLNKLVDLEEKR